MNQRTLYRILFPVILFVLVLITYWTIFTTTKLPGGAMSDTVSQGYPFMTFTEESIRDGHLPHWNPYVFCGIPFYSSFSSPVFYPVRGLLMLLTGAEGTIRFLFPIQMFLAGIFAWLFLGALKVSKWGRIIGAIAYAAAPWSNTLFYAGHGSKMICWSFLPLILFAAERWMTTRRGLFIAIGGFALGMQALSSHPQMVLYSTGALLVWFMFKLFAKHGSLSHRIGSALVGFILIVVIGMTVSAVQLLPGYNFSRYSTRGDGLSLDQAASYSLPPEESATMLFPHLFGYRHGFRDSTISNVPIYFGRLGLRLSSEFTGVLVFLLALAAFTGSKSKYRWPLLAIILSGLIVSWGGYTPVFGWLYKIIPVFRKLRAPHMAAFLTTAGIALTAGIGFDTLFKEKSEFSKKFMYATAAFTAICIILYLVAGPLITALQNGWWARNGVPNSAGFESVVDKRIDLASPDFLKATAIGIILSVLLYMKLIKNRILIAGIIITVVVSYELISVDRDFQVFLRQTSIEALYPDNSALVESVGDGRLFPGGNQFVPLHIRSVGGYHAAKTASAELLQSALTSEVALRQTAFTVLSSGEHTFTYSDFRNTVIQQYAAEYPAIADSVRAILPPTPQPRLFFAGSYTVLSNEQIESALSLGYNPQENTLLEETPGVIPSSLNISEETPGVIPSTLNMSEENPGIVPSTLNMSEENPGIIPSTLNISGVSAEFRYDGTERISILTDNPNEGLLVLADTWYPNWLVSIDGEPAELLRANGWQRAVVVPAGSHYVEFLFDSSDVDRGLLITLCGIACVCIIVGLDILGKRQRRKDEEG